MTKCGWPEHQELRSYYIQVMKIWIYITMCYRLEVRQKLEKARTRVCQKQWCFGISLRHVGTSLHTGR